MKRAITYAALIVLATLDTSPLHAQSSTVPSDAEIRQILVDRIDRDRQSVEIAVDPCSMATWARISSRQTSC
jgi:hypothetical protein